MYIYIHSIYRHCIECFFIYTTYVYTFTQAFKATFQILLVPGVVDLTEWRNELQELRHFISKCFSDQKEVMEHLHSTSTNTSGDGHGYGGARSSFARNTIASTYPSGSPLDGKQRGDPSESSSNSSQAGDVF